jgi:hypothetical protein
MLVNKTTSSYQKNAETEANTKISTQDSGKKEIDYEQNSTDKERNTSLTDNDKTTTMQKEENNKSSSISFGATSTSQPTIKSSNSILIVTEKSVNDSSANTNDVTFDRYKGRSTIGPVSDVADQSKTTKSDGSTTSFPQKDSDGKTGLNFNDILSAALSYRNTLSKFSLLEFYACIILF